MAHLFFRRSPQTHGQPGQHVTRNQTMNPERSSTPGSDVVGSGVSSHSGEITLTKRIRSAFRWPWFPKPNSNRSESSVPNKTSSASHPSKTSQALQTRPVALGSTSYAADAQTGPEGAEGDEVAPQSGSVQAHRSKNTTARERRPRQEKGGTSPHHSHQRTTSRAPTLNEGTLRPTSETLATPSTPSHDPKVLTSPIKNEFEPQPFNHHRQRSIFKRIDCVLGARFCRGANISTSSLRRSASVSYLPAIQSRQPRETPLQKRFSLTELREGLLLTNGQPSAALNALDCTDRLSQKTRTQGAGAYSDVSKAILDNHHMVAVKSLRTIGIEGTDEIRMRKRLGREIYVWAELHHPHVLKFLGFAFEDKTPCLISPWCENGNLQAYLQKYKGADRRLLVRQIAEGLRYLHDQRPPVVHGDFKTTNVLVTEKHIAKICDFGSSKRLGGIKTGFTTIAPIIGTLRYTAPEIMLESKPQTLESDVYSFACVALETMTGKYPFWGLDFYGIVYKATRKETLCPDDYPELKDEILWGLLQRCWIHEPSERPTMIEVCKKLAAANFGPPYSFYLAN